MSFAGVATAEPAGRRAALPPVAVSPGSDLSSGWACRGRAVCQGAHRQHIVVQV